MSIAMGSFQVLMNVKILFIIFFLRCKNSKNLAFSAIIFVLFTFLTVFLAHKVWSIENKYVLLHSKNE